MSGRLIVFSGPPCSWKSTLAAQLARKRELPHLEMDRTRRRLMPRSEHTREDRQIAYRAMLYAAELLLERGLDVVLDAPYGHAEDRRELSETAERTAARLFLIECAVSPEMAVERFRRRGPDAVRRDLTEERVKELVGSFHYQNTGLWLDTNLLPAEVCLQRVEAYVG
jgi:predicted kinase